MPVPRTIHVLLAMLLVSPSFAAEKKDKSELKFPDPSGLPIHPLLKDGTPPAPVAAAQKAAGLRTGLALVVGAIEDAPLAELARGGMLAHGLCPDEATLAKVRAGLAASGLDGLASAETWDERQLPYADRLADLLIADLDALGAKAPPRAEMERVVRPEGVLWLREKGAWKAHRLPADDGLGEWGHFYGDAAGTHCSNDRRVGQPRQVQWLSYEQPAVTGSNPAAYAPLYGMRIDGGRVYNWIYDHQRPETAKRHPARLNARSAFNGLLAWVKPYRDAPSIHRMGFAAAADRVISYVPTEDHVHVFSGETGEPIAVWKDAHPLKNERRVGGWPGNEGNYRDLRIGERIAVSVRLDEVQAIDPASGAVRWSWSSGDPKVLVCAMGLDEGANRVYLALHDGKPLAEENMNRKQPNYKVYDMSGRWPRAWSKEVLALDLATGKPAWRTTELAGQVVGQVVPAGGNLIVYGSYRRGGLHCLDAATGTIRWSKPTLVGTDTYSVLVRGDEVVVNYGSRLLRFALADGKELPSNENRLNSRCVRMSASADYVFYGLGFILDDQMRDRFLAVARPGCSQSLVPAQGFVYANANACGCIHQLRGTVALTAEAPRPPVPEERRLQRGGRAAGGAAAPLAELPALPSVDWRNGDWMRQRGVLPAETEPVQVDGVDYVAVVHRHRLEARKGGKLLWGFTADARISGRPVVEDGRVLFGAHDGWVYCLDAANGDLRWRHLLAPFQRRILVDGQIQSCFPVYEVLMHGGRICAAAGLHAALAGGIVVAGLDPATGAAAWKQTLEREPEVHQIAGGRIETPRSLTHPPINTGLQIKDGALMLHRFAIDPGESAEALRRRLHQPGG